MTLRGRPELEDRAKALPGIDEFLALDLLTLREHTEQAGDDLDPQAHAERLRQSLQVAQVCAVRRGGRLVAYAMLCPDKASAGGWFVTAFNSHPRHRTPAVMRDLFQAFAEVIQRCGISELRSHVYKTNRPSVAFHRKLGFRANRENAKGIEFLVSVDELLSHPVVARVASKPSVHPSVVANRAERSRLRKG